MDREETAKHTLVFGAYGANAICWRCKTLTRYFSDPEATTADKVLAATRKRADMYLVIRDGTPRQCQELSIHPCPLAMDILAHVPCDYSWCLADRFHHQTVVMWSLKQDTELLASKYDNLHLLNKRFMEQPRHSDVKPWPRGIVVVNKVCKITGLGVMGFGKHPRPTVPGGGAV